MATAGGRQRRCPRVEYSGLLARRVASEVFLIWAQVMGPHLEQSVFGRGVFGEVPIIFVSCKLSLMIINKL